MVEPLRPLKGTDYISADIQIPAVRFWRYVGNGGESTELTVPPQSHGTPGEPVDWQPDGWAAATTRSRCTAIIHFGA